MGLVNLNNTLFAYVRGNSIFHAGKIIGKSKDMVLLSGKGLKSYPYVAKWVPSSEIIPLSDANNLHRNIESFSESEKRKRRKK